jgi:hypothetical protein
MHEISTETIYLKKEAHLELGGRSTLCESGLSGDDILIDLALQWWQ